MSVRTLLSVITVSNLAAVLVLTAVPHSSAQMQTPAWGGGWSQATVMPAYSWPTPFPSAPPTPSFFSASSFAWPVTPQPQLQPLPPVTQTKTYFAYDLGSVRGMMLPQDTVTADDLYAWDTRAMNAVRQAGPAPTIAAKVYAQMTLAQAEVIAIGTALGASSRAAIDVVSAGVLCSLLQKECRGATTDAYAAAVSRMVLAQLQQRNDADARAIAPVNPYPVAGGGVWTGENPATPAAGGWMTWGEQSWVAAAPPPGFQSAQDLLELQAVRDAVKNLTPAQRERVLFWAGSKGSETPAGIWLGVADDQLRATGADVSRAAEVRSRTMMAVFDAFVLCWKTKFTYWTARPTQRDPSIVTVIPVPPFPSYPSGHATISGAAGEMLATFFPGEGNRFRSMAQEAADSRIWAGIHFPIDGSAGLTLGTQAAGNVRGR